MNNPAHMCDDHPGQVWIHCSPCRGDALASGSHDAVIAWHARRQVAELAARIPARYANATVTVDGVKAWVNRWHADPSDCPSLVMVGPVGTGKTYQGYGAIREAVTGPNSLDWHVVSEADLYASLRPRAGVDTEELMERYRTVGLLMIDDLGVAKRSEYVEEVTYRVIDARYEALRPCIFTSNVMPKDFSKSFGDRIASRLVETCQVVAVTGPDRRRKVATV